MRSLSTPLIQSLMEEEPFRYAHLVKFEKPIKTESGKPTKSATSYSYITDASIDISYNDNSSNILGTPNGAQTYIANRLIDVSSISETIEARASNFSITIGAAALNTSLDESFTVTGSNPYVITGTKNLVEAGFLEGDEIALGSPVVWTGRIDKFTANAGIPNASASLTVVEGAGSTGSVTKIAVNTKDIGAILLDKTQGSYARYINREVYVYKAHINTTNGAIIGNPFLLFKGIITSGSLTEDPKSESKMVWNISSHWGDWVRVNGRITSDSSHRALSNDGTSDRSAILRPEYADDLGFLHSEQALNIMASYKVSETRYKTKKSGLFGLKVKLKEYQVLVDREVDLRFNLEAKYLPVVYGVQRLDCIPFFVDTDKNAPNKVYAAYALCEGEIGGIFDIYFGDQSSICLDADDSAVRSSTTTTANIDVICSGRADRGDTLAGQTVTDTSTTLYADILKFNTGQLTLGNNLFAANFDRRYFNRNGGFSGGVAATIDPLGITHEKGRSFTDPIDCKFVVHTGKEEQRADDILVAKAQNNEFKVQGAYYTGDKSQYWGANHRVLDTAYVTAEYILSEGEEELPSVEFIVKGKAVECYNYDYSYIHDPTATGETPPTIGSTVTLSTGGSVVVADVFTDEFGQPRVRFLTNPNIGSVSKFNITGTVYTLLASNAVLASGTVPSVLQTAVSSSTFNAPTQTYNITTLAGGVGSFGGVNLPDLRYTIADALLSDTSALTTEQKNLIRIRLGGSSIPSGTSSTTVNGITNNTNVAPAFVITKNGIKLAAAASAANDAYNSFIIELTRTNSDGSVIVQKRTITDYDGTNKIATTDRDWDAVYYPNTNDTYKIYAPSDKRITNNPAMQLLDYITSVRYGRGLDVTNDINLETFKEAARKCDTRSDITVTTATQATVGDIYTHTTTGLKFRGKVVSSTLINGLYETTFTDVIGKLGNKWFDWKSYAVGDYIWNNGAVYRVDTAGTFSAWPPTSNATLISTSFTLARVGGGSITVNIASSSFDGNPIVKKYVSGSKSYISGYSLYDCDDVKYWRYVGWNSQNQRHVTRHQTNIIINTSNPVFDNINTLLGHFNGILRYNAGKYELDVEGQHSSTSGVYGYNEVITNLNSWSVSGATRSSTSIAVPFGCDPAIKISDNAGSPPQWHWIGQSIPTAVANDVLIFSTYLKAAEYSSAALMINVKDNTFVGANFDLTGTGAYKNSTGLAAGIYLVGNGWYRCWVAANTKTGGTTPAVYIINDYSYAVSGFVYEVGSPPGTGSVGSGIYVSSVKVEYNRALDYTSGPTSYIYYPNIIGEEDIIGAISVEDPGNKDTFNTISIDIPDPRNRFEERSVTYFNSTYLIEDNSVPKKGDMKATGITNYFNARMNAKQYLEQSRYGLKINFTMPPKGLLITAGEIIEITNSRLGFVSKPFRVTNLTVNKDCLVQISADEHTNNAYSIAPSSGGVFASSEPAKGITLAPKEVTGASATNNQSGVITLNWTNPSGFNSDTDSIEIYRAVGASSLQENSNLIAVVSGGMTTYSDPLAAATDTFYNYWIRTRRDSYRSSNNSNVRTFSIYTATIPGKVLASVTSTIYSVVVSAPVIFKDAPDAATSGSHTNVTISGVRTIGNTTSPFGFVTFTGNGLTEASPAPFSSITTSISPDAGRTFYTARLYDSSPKTNLLDSQEIPVVFKGATGTSGTDPITVAYTNNNHSVPVTTNGAETWPGSGGKFYVYKGQTALTLASNTIGFTPNTNDTYAITSFSLISGSSLTPPASVNGATTTETTIGDFAGDLTTVTVYRLTTTVRINGANLTRAIDITFAPSNQGATGDAATSYWVSTNPGALSKNNVNAFTPSSVVFSAFSKTGTALAAPYSGVFKIYENGSGTPTTTTGALTSTTYTPSSGCTSIKVELYTPNGVTELDEQGVAILNSASNAITAVLSNDSHVFTSDNSGSVSTYANSGTEIRLYEGATELIYSPPAAGNGKWRVSATGTNITPSSPPTDSGTYVTYGAHSAALTDSSKITYTINGKTSTGAAITNFTKDQTFSKSKTGAGGAAGTNVAQVYAYKRVSTAPTDNPGAVEYTFSSSSITSPTTLLNSWQKTIPTGTSPLYVTVASASSSTSIDSIGANEWASPVLLSGTDGIAGSNVATVFLYRRTANSNNPGAAAGVTDTTYTFSSGAVASPPSNWSSSIPSSGGNYIWSIQATAFSSTNSDAIGIGEWSTPVLTSQIGTDGINAVVATLSKDSHIFPASPNGTVTNYTGANTEVRVYDGATLLTYSPPAAGNGKWTVSSTSGSNITVPSAVDSGTFATYTYTTGVGQLVDTSSATFNISGKTTGGNSFTLVKVQSFSKSKVGTTGDQGNPGTPATYITLSKSSTLVTAYADGGVKAGEFPVLGTLKVFNGSTDVTASSTLSSTTSGCVGLVSPDGTYRITAFSPTTVDTGVLTLSAQYPQTTGPTYTAAFTVSKNKIGYEIVADITALNALTPVFPGRMAFVTSEGKLYRYVGAPTNAWISSVSGADINPATLPSTAFTSDIQPIKIWSTTPLPASPNAAGVNGALTLFYNSDKKLYRWDSNSNSYVATVQTADLSGTITNTQIANSAITAAKFDSGIKPVEVFGSLPSPQPVGRVVFLTTNNKLYRATGTAWTSVVDGSDISPNSIDISKFTTDIQPLKIVTSVNPLTTYLGADVVFNETDGKLYRWDTTLNPDAYTVNVPSGDLFGQIVSGQISDNAITGSKLAVGDFSVLNRNWNFEEGDTQWSKTSGWAIVNNTANAKSGDWVASKTGSSTINSLINSQTVATEEGETFYAEAYIKNTGSTVGSTSGTAVRIVCLDKSGDVKSTFTGNYISPLTTLYTKSSLSIVVPSTTSPTVSVQVRVASVLPSPTSIAYVDEVRLFRTSNTTLIADGAITTDKITVNTLDADRLLAGTITAAKIGAGQITAGKLAVGDFENLCTNPSGTTNTTDGWSTTVTSPTVSVGGLPSNIYSLRATNRDNWQDQWFDVKAGDEFYLKGDFYPAQAGNNPPTADAAVMLVTASDTNYTNPGYFFSTYANRNSATWQTMSGTATVPAGARYARLAVQINGTVGSTGSWYFRAIEVRRKNAGNLIVDGAITANKVAAGSITTTKLTVADISRVFSDVFDSTASIEEWTNNSGAAELSIVTVADSVYGGKVLQVGNNSGNDQAWLIHNRNIPFDPNTTYRLRIRLKKTLGTGLAYVGWAGVAADGTTLVNTLGSPTFTSQHYHTILGTQPTATYTEYTGYTRGFGVSTGTATVGTNTTPGQMHPNVRYIRPLVLVNNNSVAGTTFIDAVTVDVVADANLIVDGAITANKIDTNAVTADKILAGSISAAKIATGSITARKIALISDNLNRDADFDEGIINGSITSPANSYWTAVNYQYNYSGYSPTSTAWRVESAVSPQPQFYLGWRKYAYLSSPYTSPGMRHAVYWSETNSDFIPGYPIEGNEWYEVATQVINNSNCALEMSSEFFTATGDWHDPGNRVAQGNWFASMPANSSGELNHRFLTNPAAARYRALIQSVPVSPLASPFTGNISFAKMSIRKMADANLIVDGAITTNKLIVTGAGKAINGDPGFQDSSAWVYNGDYGGTFSLLAGSPDNPVGSRVLQSNGGGVRINSKNIQISAGTQYKVSVWAKRVSGVGSMYIRFTTVDSSSGLTGYVVSALQPIGLTNFENISPSTTWTKYVGTLITAANSVNAFLDLYLNWGASPLSGSSMRVTDFRAEEYIGADLIVNGAITADKVAAGAITTAKLDAGNINADVLAAGTITAAKIATNTITASRIAVTSNDDLFPDPGFFDFTWWGFGTNTYYSGQNGSGTAQPNRYLRVTGNMVTPYDYSTPTIPIEVGATYRAKLRIFISTTATGWIATNIHLPMQDWYTPAPRNYVAGIDNGPGDYPVIDMSATTIPKGSWQTYTGTFTFAANTAGAYVQFRNRALITAGYVEYCWEVVRAANSELIVDGAIIADKIAANSITASKLAVGDFSVLNRNWDFEEGNTQWTLNSWTINNTSGQHKSGSWCAVRPSGVLASGAIVNTQTTPAEEGETFYAEAYIKHAASNAGGTGTAIRIIAQDANGNTVAGGTFTGNSIGVGSTTYTKSSVEATMPAGTARVNVRVSVLTNMSTNNGIYVDEVRLFRTSNATLISNGAITTDKIFTGAITTAKIATNQITADLMTSNSVTARELAISLDASPSASSGIYMDATNNRIDIFNAGVLRVRLGNLA